MTHLWPHSQVHSSRHQKGVDHLGVPRRHWKKHDLCLQKKKLIICPQLLSVLHDKNLTHMYIYIYIVYPYKSWTVGPAFVSPLKRNWEETSKSEFVVEAWGYILWFYAGFIVARLFGPIWFIMIFGHYQTWGTMTKTKCRVRDTSSVLN